LQNNAKTSGMMKKMTNGKGLPARLARYKNP
jgi:hypothetical protein